MTHNQIDYANYKENVRHNVATEAEYNRHNVVVEEETYRHNVVGEVETNRHNVATEGLMHESNMVSYSVGMANAAATRYAAELNYQVGMTNARNNYTLGMANIGVASRNATTNERNAETNRMNAYTKSTEVKNNLNLGLKNWQTRENEFVRDTIYGSGTYFNNISNGISNLFKTGISAAKAYAN